MTKDKDKRNFAQYKTVNYSVFANAASKLSITPAELSAAIGYSNHTHIGWKGRKEMPKTAGLACECLLRRKKKESAEVQTDLYFLAVPKLHSIPLESLCETLGIGVQRINLTPAA